MRLAIRKLTDDLKTSSSIRAGATSALELVDARGSKPSKAIRLLWLTSDVDDILRLYEGLERTPQALHAALVPILKSSTLSFYVVQGAWSVVHIIPMVRGKVLVKQTYSLSMASLLSNVLSSQDMHWKLHPDPIPEEIWDTLGIESCEEASAEVIGRFHRAANNCLLALSHAADIADMPDVNRVGVAVLHDYFEWSSQRLSRRLKEFFNAEEEICAEVLPVLEKQGAGHPYAYALAERLNALRVAMLPDGDMSQDVHVSLAELRSKREQILHAFELVEEIRIYWLAAVLGTPGESWP